MSNQLTYLIYHPLLIKTLVDSEGTTITRKIALEFLKYDENQIQYYEGVVKSMPVRVLLKHQIITKEKNNILLNTKDLSFSQKPKIKSLCDQKLNHFLESPGLKLWDCRLIDNPVSNSLRYKVLRNSG